MTSYIIVSSIIAVVFLLFYINLEMKVQRLKSIQGSVQYIENYQFPDVVKKDFLKRHPHVEHLGYQNVEMALKQYFGNYSYHWYSKSVGNKKFLMPSKLADELWHSLILDTKAYAEFCNKAFGKFLHHIPEGSASLGNTQVAALNTYHGIENIKRYGMGYMAGGIPLLFALDSLMNVEGGYYYNLATIEAVNNPSLKAGAWKSS